MTVPSRPSEADGLATSDASGDKQRAQVRSHCLQSYFWLTSSSVAMVPIFALSPNAYQEFPGAVKATCAFMSSHTSPHSSTFPITRLRALYSCPILSVEVP